jgi:hypothetical protein
MPPAATSRRALALASVTAFVSVGLLLLAVARGWLGPDVGRGDGFCEARPTGPVRQPANSWSNLGFVVAGLLIARRADDPRATIGAHPGLAAAFGSLVVFLGPASAAMHATQSATGGHLDLLSMFLVSSFASAYAVMRITRGGVRLFAAWFVASLVVSELAERGTHRDLPVLDSWANAAFGAFLLLAVACEAVLHGRPGPRADLRWGLGAVGAMALAFTVWNLSKDGAPLCRPASLLQGHAFWHVMCAVAAYCLYRFWASEGGRR